MNVSLPSGLSNRIECELATGRYANPDELTVEAVRYFPEDRSRVESRLSSLRRIGQAVEDAGLYEKVLLPDHE